MMVAKPSAFLLMTQRLQTRLLYLALALYICVSLSFWLAGAVGLERSYWHSGNSVEEPFQMDDDLLTVTSVRPEAAAAGLRKGDVVESLDGLQYSGINQRSRLWKYAHPGDTLAVGVRHADGSHAVVRLRYALHYSNPGSMGQWLGIALLVIVPTVIALLVGYWIVIARPRDKNAWLILVVLSFPEVFYFQSNSWPGPWLPFIGAWYQLLQTLGGLALFLLGVYFPERWRFDHKFPSLRRALVAIFCLALLWVYTTNYHEYLHPGWATWIAASGPWFERIIQSALLLCVVLYWVALYDKMRTASTPDVRRRLRVLLAGSLVGIGSVIVFVVWFPHFGHYTQRHVWPRYTGAVLFLFYPFTLAYVVLVERAMDVRILVRMGTKYALARASVQVLRIALVIFLTFRFLIPMLRKGEHRPMDLLIIALILAGFVRIFTAQNSPTSRLGRWIDKRFFREAYDAELVLSDLSEQVRRITEPQSLVDTVSRRIGEVLHVREVALLLDGGHQGFQLQSANGAGPVYLSQNSYTVRNLKRSNGPVTLYRENPDGWFLLADEEERSLLNRLHTEVLLPVNGRDRLMGVMTLSAKRSEAPYTPSDLRLLQNVATQAGFALEISELGRSLASEAAQRERIHREIEIAREVQERLFPQVIPKIEGATLAGACRPAQGVGGDYYDLIAFDDGEVGLAVGDVSGKGISAALVMASLRASLRGMLMDGPGDLAHTMAKVNRLVYEASTSNRYATFFFGAYDPRTRKLCYVNAGHNPPVVLRGEETLRLEAGGPVIGLLPDVEYEERSLTLQSGDLLLAYTDGISEAMTLDEEEWGEEGMIAAACADPKHDAAEVLQCVFAGADAFAGAAPQYDDMTLLVLKLNAT